MIHFFLSFFNSKTKLQLEIIFLRKQLEILNRTNKKLHIKIKDRLFFVLIKSIFNCWRESLIIIKPETVIKWHRKGFNYIENGNVEISEDDLKFRKNKVI